MKVTDSIRHLAYYNIVHFPLIMLYSTGPSVVNTVGLLSLNSCLGETKFTNVKTHDFGHTLLCYLSQTWV